MQFEQANAGGGGCTFIVRKRLCGITVSCLAATVSRIKCRLQHGRTCEPQSSNGVPRIKRLHNWNTATAIEKRPIQTGKGGDREGRKRKANEGRTGDNRYGAENNESCEQAGGRFLRRRDTVVSMGRSSARFFQWKEYCIV